jgi:hypothetical protein
MQVISNIMKHPTKIEHCSKHNLFIVGIEIKS